MQEYEDNIIVYPPNKIVDRNCNFSEKPLVHKSLTFIDFNSKREAILGSSNVNGTLWEGTTFFFRNNQDLEDLKWSASYIGPTVSDGKFIDDNTVVLAEETGDVQILNIEEKSKLESYLFFRHFSRIPQLAVWNQSPKILTCSERTLMLIDTSSSKKLVFPDFHTELIYSVDALKYNENRFVSCGADRKALIWDLRDPNLATVLYTNEFAELTSIAWNQANDEYIVCATESGAAYLLDKREPNSFVEVHHCFDNKINRLSFNPNSNQLAVSGNTNEILVLDWDGEGLNRVYNSKEHKGIVRGLSWCQNELFSCGFDTVVKKHVV